MSTTSHNMTSSQIKANSGGKLPQSILDVLSQHDVLQFKSKQDDDAYPKLLDDCYSALAIQCERLGAKLKNLQKQSVQLQRDPKSSQQDRSRVDKDLKNASDAYRDLLECCSSVYAIRDEQLRLNLKESEKFLAKLEQSFKTLDLQSSQQQEQNAVDDPIDALLAEHERLRLNFKEMQVFLAMIEAMSRPELEDDDPNSEDEFGSEDEELVSENDEPESDDDGQFSEMMVLIRQLKFKTSI
ncbi:hypothetical protein BS50DRAFT_629958 [Corynespora cassiicola Philippines]|uniref:Uncharacterized protein n=1 Tax=Corynespora cassiicola Philippines TaxID=1448308 RepID=A0A2T2P2C8_CORCC|nr:hypothetical protein BS50DRAFT_629958 [Corynespora cassiicola Philippines]